MLYLMGREMWDDSLYVFGQKFQSRQSRVHRAEHEFGSSLTNDKVFSQNALN